ncbi:ABC transporter ATP-binding protein [Microvirga subterranea]|uniref:Energy-coupling factor transport system ATP-binding protein n=1 Tax=Microvirga subterranea TaxID=186651 RepID=A0A370HUA9_9HYPH|nr:ATP-binding cassette domain-containing protein [Microvirga subterranea]RDI61945.1 energy-coupling factor transport system ATP-binding protein [Microvirga subterranea]
MPEAAEWRGVSVRYPFVRSAAVGPASLSVRPGERVLLLGPSGSGKSTLLLTLTGLIPESIPAVVEGDVRLFGADVATRKPWGWAPEVAQYFQDADQTLCGMRVEDEIGFALENQALPEDGIAERIADAMQRVGIPEGWRSRPSSSLSGGEKQLVALAATLVQNPPLFIADEPTAHLAPQAANRLHALLTEHDGSRSVLIVDHRLDGLIQAIDRMVVLDRSGTVIADGEPRTIFREKREHLAELGIWRPAASLLDARLAEAGMAPPVAPLSVEEALAHVDPDTANQDDVRKARPSVKAFVVACAAPAVAAAHDPPVVARLMKADCAPFLGPTVLRGIDLAIRAGEVVGILGANGAGKSTLGLCLSGLLPLKSGRRTGAPGGYAFQRPENQFTAGTVRDEILAALPKSGADRSSPRVADILASWDLAGFENRHPFELSQGQKRRLALASLTASDRWPLLVLDEPTAGLDARSASDLVERVGALSRKGRAIAVITHDMDLALRLCPRAIVVGEGAILADAPTGELMSDAPLLARAGLAEPSCAPAMRWLRRAAAC